MDRREFLRLGLLAGGGMVVSGGLARMLLAARGGTSFSLPTSPTGVFTVAAAPDGGWSWFGDPRAVEYNGHLYTGYVDASGNVGLIVTDLNTLTQVANITLRALDYDDHANPSFLVRASDHKLMVWAQAHDPQDAAARMWISTTSLDTDPNLSDGFDAEVNLDSQIQAGSYNYPNPFQLSNGDIHLFYREGNATAGVWIRTVSIDDGATWSAHTDYYSDSLSYVRIRQVGDRLHFAVTNSSPNVFTTSLGHFYWEGGSYYRSDGTEIVAAGALDYSDATVVHDSSNTWVWDIAVDSLGNPYILHPTWATEFSDHRYNRAAWNGSAWSSEEITAAGQGIDVTGVYSGGMCFDPTDPDIVYASREVSGQWEMYRYVKDGTWGGTALTTGSSAKHIRPFVAGTTVVWLTGTYTGWSAGFNMGTSGYRP